MRASICEKIVTGLVILSLAAAVAFFTWAQYSSAAEVAVDTAIFATNANTNGSHPGIVWTSETNGYVFYRDASFAVAMASTTDGGATWSAPRQVDSVNPVNDLSSFAVWWEGWTPGTTTARYIHIVTVDLGVDDTYYTRLDTQTGAFTTTVLGTTQAAGCADGSSCYSSITMTATGTLYMVASDNTDSWVVRCGTYLTCSTTTNWIEIAGPGFSLNNSYPALMPIPGTDNILAVWHDTGDSSIRSNIFSATSSSWWKASGAPTLLVSSIEFNTTYDYQLMGAALSTTTGLIYFANTDDTNDYTTADHDIDVRTFSTSTWSWTTRTDCVNTASGGLTGAKLAYNEANDTLYCIYGRRTTIGTATTTNIYYKTSTDNGTSWSSESVTTVNTTADNINGLSVNILSDARIGVTWNYTTAPNADQQFHESIYPTAAAGSSEAAATTPSTLIQGAQLIVDGGLVIIN